MSEPIFAFTIDTTSAVPPFEQLRIRIASMTSSGELEPGTRLPTIRRLATDLGLAPNTVARAYRELESDGVLVTHGRQGTFVYSALNGEGQSRLTELAAEFVQAARRGGRSESEATRMVEQAWRAH